ncbi:MAG: hypothetical protein QOG74_1002 [Alphaproteobacteria bacterium]|nr:hypothetical protein [Alphaproteobacteria bacterium]
MSGVFPHSAYLSRLRGSVGRLRRPFLKKNEAELRLSHAIACGGWGKSIHEHTGRKRPHPNPPPQAGEGAHCRFVIEIGKPDN